MPIVTVIVPVYKVMPYLHRCVDSILKQTFTDFELILVDDGSPDQCGAICDEYAEKDSRVHVIHKENGGLSSARNAGLSMARGEYIYFVDSDDYLDPDLLERAIDGIQGYDMVSFDYRLVDEEGRIIQKFQYKHGPASWENEQEQLSFLIDVFFRYGIWSVWSKMYRKNIIDRNKLFFEDNRKIFAEDLYFTFLYLLHCRSINCLDAECYSYLSRDDSIMGIQTKQHNLGRMIELIKAIEKHLAAQPGFSYMKAEFHIFFEELFSVALNQTKAIIGERNISAVRETIYSDVQDLTFFKDQTTELLKHKNDLCAKLGIINGRRILSEYRYYLGGSLVEYKISHSFVRLLRRLFRIIRIAL